MKYFFSFMFCLTISGLAYSKSVKLTGKIGGKYAIDMELDKSTDSDNPIQGKYKYSGKENYLTLKGKMYSDYVIYLEEFNSKGKQTGAFYLSWEEGFWKGKWTGNEKYFDVELKVQTGDMKRFKEFDFSEMKEKSNESLTGSYAFEYYFLNDMWLHETGNMEIGFNGGVVSVDEVDKDSLKIQFELICGPTYHIAYFDGYAIKKSENEYEIKSSLYEEDEPCHLKISFKNKVLSIEQNSSSMDCGFGARAYADGDFTKIHNKTAQGETIDIDDVLKLKGSQ